MIFRPGKLCHFSFVVYCIDIELRSGDNSMVIDLTVHKILGVGSNVQMRLKNKKYRCYQVLCSQEVQNIFNVNRFTSYKKIKANNLKVDPDINFWKLTFWDGLLLGCYLRW